MRSNARISSTGCCWDCCLSNMKILCRTGCLVLMAVQLAAPAARLKELVGIEGVRENQLLGYGLVVGLAGTGDKKQTVFPVQTLANLLDRMGVNVSPAALTVKNT